MESPEQRISPILSQNKWQLLAHEASTPCPYFTSDESGYCTNGTLCDDDESPEIQTFAMPTRLKSSSSFVAANIIYYSPDESINYRKNLTCNLMTDTPSVNKRSPNTIVPLSGQEVGKKHIDFLNELSNRRNCLHIISKILRYLSPFELCKVSWVSKAWRNVCLNDDYSRSIVENYLHIKQNLKEEEKENAISFKTPSTDKILRRTPFNNVQNMLLKEYGIMQEKKNISWPKSRYQLFQEEANKLHPGERLQICPRCGSPSRVITVEQRGLCSQLSCSFDFCIICLNEFHQQLSCKIKSKPIGKSHSIGSKQSKRKLKRL